MNAPRACTAGAGPYGRPGTAGNGPWWSDLPHSTTVPSSTSRHRAGGVGGSWSGVLGPRLAVPVAVCGVAVVRVDVPPGQVAVGGWRPPVGLGLVSRVPERFLGSRRRTGQPRVGM